MVRIFDRNMFIMLLAIMIGVIIITYFVADIARRSEIEFLRTEVQTITEMSMNFTDHFMKSSVLLDAAREDRAFGNYHFDLAFLWYNNALSEKKKLTMERYKDRAVDNCTNAMPKYLNSNHNFKSAKSFFESTKMYTNNYKYLEILDLYVGFTESGARLAMLRYNASKYLMRMVENLTMVNGVVTYSENVSELLDLFNETQFLYEQELKTYNEYQKEIDEYEFFDEIR